MPAPETHRAAPRAPDATREVCAVVVTFHPDLAVLECALEALAPQVSRVVVVDNGSTAAGVAAIDRLPGAGRRTVLALGDNFGVAAAHNRGIDWARRQGFGYVLLLDQDSEPAPGMVQSLLEAHVEASRRRRVSAVGPRYVDRERGFSSYFVRFGLLTFRRIFCDGSERLIETDFLISSGALISIDALDAIGGMDEALFIDHVDTEWFLRARSLGFASFGVCAAEMRHSLGNDTIRLPLLGNRNIPVHSPLRHYYVFRNSVLLMKRPYPPAAWRANNLFRLSASFLVFMLFAPRRLARLAMIAKGIGHGLRNRSGRLA